MSVKINLSMMCVSLRSMIKYLLSLVPDDEKEEIEKQIDEFTAVVDKSLEPVCEKVRTLAGVVVFLSASVGAIESVLEFAKNERDRKNIFN